jgi:Spy/CpxP family protein refolding chaperone
MKFAIAFAAALTLASVGAFADDAATPAAGSGHGACKADIAKFCAGIDHEKGKIHECLTQHQADLSDACKQRMAAHAAKSN